VGDARRQKQMPPIAAITSKAREISNITCPFCE
jgi:hypothetical protein